MLNIEFDKSLEALTTFGLPSTAEAYVEVDSLDALR